MCDSAGADISEIDTGSEEKKKSPVGEMRREVL